MPRAAAGPGPPLAALSLLCLAALLASCAAAPISPEVLGQVNKEITMAELVANPQAHAGQVVLLGGYIIQTRNLPEASEVEVLEAGLDGDQRPQGEDTSQGRFLARLPGWRDPAIFSPGRQITVAGRVSGSQRRPVGQVQYRYPVLEALDWHLWPGRQADGYPNVFFSIGVGTAF